MYEWVATNYIPTHCVIHVDRIIYHPGLQTDKHCNNTSGLSTEKRRSNSAATSS